MNRFSYLQWVIICGSRVKSSVEVSRYPSQSDTIFPIPGCDRVALPTLSELIGSNIMGQAVSRLLVAGIYCDPTDLSS